VVEDRKVKVRVVRVKGKNAIVEELKTILSGLEHWISYNEVEGDDEEENILYRYEELHVAGQVDNVYITMTCDNDSCKTEAAIYNYLVEPCYSKPVPSDVTGCVRRVASSVKKVQGLVKELQAMAQELAQHGFEVNKVLEGAEAYWSKAENNAKSYIRVHLNPRTPMLQFQVEAEPMILVKIARTLTKLVG
jgi:hypothetical protein